MVSTSQRHALMGDLAWVRSAFHRIGRRIGGSGKEEEGTENLHGALSIFVLRKITFRKEHLSKLIPPELPESLREGFCSHLPQLEEPHI